MKITESQLRQLIKEVLEVQELSSPLSYDRWSHVLRISLVDSDSPDFKKYDTYFSQTKKSVLYGPSGRRLKNPKTEIVPGAASGTVAFLDYHVPMKDYIYIDYMKTRMDMRGMGHAKKLIDELVKKFGKDVTYDFGKIMNPAIGKLQKDLAAKGYKVSGWHDY